MAMVLSVIMSKQRNGSLRQPNKEVLMLNSVCQYVMQEAEVLSVIMPKRWSCVQKLLSREILQLKSNWDITIIMAKG